MSVQRRAHVAVLGGGLAGITAALDCASAGAQVTLVEVRPRLGGAAYSFEREGLMVDNGQHVFLRCCTAYRALLGRLGSAEGVHVQRRLEIPVLHPDGRRALLRRNALPAWLTARAPVHLLGTLARYPFLRPAARARAALAARALGGVDARSRAADRESLGAWLTAHGQDDGAIASLWDLIALPTLNVRAGQASLALGAFVFQTGLLSDPSAGDIGFHMAPLGALIGEPALRALERSGVDVLLGTRAQGVEPGSHGFTVRLAGRASGVARQTSGARAGALPAEAVILALPHARAAEILPRGLEALRARIGALASSPIVNLHVIYNRPVCELPFFAAVSSPVQYVFDRSAAGGLAEGSGQYLAVSLSGASREMAMSVDELRASYLPALAALLPQARGARVERFLVTREHAATFAAAPGSGALRPPPETAVRGLVLAGSWTDTGWPATLEGAVRSGHAAARAALAAVGIECHTEPAAAETADADGPAEAAAGAAPPGDRRRAALSWR